MYKSPEVFLVVPLNQMLGGKSGATIGMLYQFVDALLDRHVDLGVIDDQHLSQLPASARLLVYPIPFHIPDEAYARLKAFVQGGGRLCITGDVSYDGLRRRTRTDRLEELCGVRFASENYPNVAWGDGNAPCVNVEPVTAREVETLYVHELGKGSVYYTPRPSGRVVTELGPDGMVFDSPLLELGKRARVQSTATHAFRIRESGGGCTYVLVNAASGTQTAALLEQDVDPVEISLGANGVGLARYDESGRLVAVESQGPVGMSEGRTLDISGHFALISCDGRDVMSSREMIVLPFGDGTLDLTSRAEADDLIIQTGDVAGGRWRVLSESADGRIDASGATAFDIRIVAPRDRLADLSRFVASEMMLTNRDGDLSACD